MTNNGHSERPVGVIGLGMVGGTLVRALAEADVPVVGYDRYLEVGAAAELAGCGVVFVCVATPSTPEGGFDTSNVWEAVKEVAPFLDDGAMIAVKSTVPPGTSDRLAEAFPQLRVVSVPEFLVAARPMETLRNPDRIVVGAATAEAGALVASLMVRVAPSAPVVTLSPTEAELVKLCSNAMLAAKVTIANELALVCEAHGVAWQRVQAGVGLDRRIGPDHISVSAERGFGGPCLPKDFDGLIAAAEAAGYEAPVLRQIAVFNRAIRRVTEPDAVRNR